MPTIDPKTGRRKPGSGQRQQAAARREERARRLQELQPLPPEAPPPEGEQEAEDDPQLDSEDRRLARRTQAAEMVFIEARAKGAVGPAVAVLKLLTELDEKRAQINAEWKFPFIVDRGEDTDEDDAEE